MIYASPPRAVGEVRQFTVDSSIIPQTHAKAGTPQKEKTKKERLKNAIFSKLC